MRIVVVEDEDNTREGIIRLLAKLDSRYEVVGEADNGSDGMTVSEETSPDVVFTDIKMPKMSGIEMLERLKERGYRHKTVILTGFSEFEYAKKAVQLGVFEFLEKPITMADLRACLDKIEGELAFEKLAGISAGDPTGRTGHLLVRLVTQSVMDISLVSRHLERTSGFRTDEPFHVISCYMGNSFESRVKEARSGLASILVSLGRFALFELPQERTLAALVQCCDSGMDFETFMKGEALAAFRRDFQAVVCSGTVECLDEAQKCYERLREIRKWSIVRGDEAVLYEPLYRQRSCGVLQYSSALANKAAAAVAEADADAIGHCFNQWLDVCLNGDFHPQHVIDACVRFVSSLLLVIGEVHGHDLSYGWQLEWLNRIMESQTRRELIESWTMIAGQASNLAGSPLPAPYSLAVQKAVRMIYDRFQDGITLEEIAASLGITPEYLSSLFAKEVKKTFSAFIKDVRIKKAKELLLHTDLKTFEIARRSGYPDAKYFSRVFREATGFTPGEYQRLHKSGSEISL